MVQLLGPTAQTCRGVLVGSLSRRDQSRDRCLNTPWLTTLAPTPLGSKLARPAVGIKPKRRGPAARCQCGRVRSGSGTPQPHLGRG